MNPARDFDDPLDDILSAPVNPVPRPAPKVAVAQAEMHFEPCRKCGGTGSVRWGTCFACQGKGGKSFKQPAAVRTHARDQAAARKENKFAAFTATPVGAYLLERAPRWPFASELLDKVRKYGDLTDNQLNAVQRAMAKDAERNAERTAAKVARESAAPTISAEPVETAFATVTRRGIGTPKLRLDTFVFSLAGPSSKNPGAIYVREGETYLGKIVAGRFHRVRDCTDEQEQRILAAAADPKNAAIAYGRRFGVCSVCNRTLSDPQSVANGIGPVCAEGWGW